MLERNLRIHLCVASYAVFFAFQVGFSRGEYAALLVTIGVMISLELLNTSVEKLCDFTENGYSYQIKIIKDVAAGAVLISAICAVAVGAFLFLRSETLDALKRIFTSPMNIAIFTVTVILACIFAFMGPLGVGKRLKSIGKKKD